MMNKKEARKYALNLRKCLNTKDASKKIVIDIIESKILEQFDVIGIYYPKDDEINLLDLVDFYPNKIFCLPKTNEEITFHKYEKNKLVFGKFNILEPVDSALIIPDIVLVPCVGINHENKRLGYGKGYYDRFSHSNGLIKYIGVCHKELIFDFKADSFDLRFDSIFVR